MEVNGEMRAIRSKRLTTGTISSTGIDVTICHCRKCMRDLQPDRFYAATDKFLDSSGYLSVCKDCVDDLYKRFYEIEHNIDRTILKLCRILDISYDESAIQALHTHIATVEAKGKEMASIFGNYKTKLYSGKVGKSANPDLTFKEPEIEIQQKLMEDYIDDQEYYEEKWGKSQDLTSEDYRFLETEFNRWTPTKIISYSDDVMIRIICHKQNDIRKARIIGATTDKLENQLLEFMKNSALTPVLQKAADAGKNKEAFGVWIGDIEEYEPAEWFDKQEKYRDMDNFQKDIDDMHRSTGNAISGSRDFNIEDMEDVSGGAITSDDSDDT